MRISVPRLKYLEFSNFIWDAHNISPVRTVEVFRWKCRDIQFVEIAFCLCAYQLVEANLRNCTETELVEKAKTGGRSAYCQLVTRFRKQILF